uniref:Glucose-6-phosphatase n=1 Tax=Plectus sambesii TaxID=2011161 RepID=A0A914VTL1_9BILA
MDQLYKWELAHLSALQKLPYVGDVRHEWIWLTITKLGDPLLAFIFYFPLLFAFHERGALKMLVGACISEFLNGVLKWLFHGERPYWYALDIGYTPLMQYPYTCETGPGSPSGHVMVSSTIFYVMITLVRCKWVSTLCWVLYAIGLALIGISRLYIGAHFPHQIVLGALIGILIGHIVSRWEPARWRPYQTLLMAGILVMIGVFTYHGLLFTGFDPNWSIAKALQHCAKAEWIHISTTPVASAIRNISTMLGLCLCQLLSTNYRLKNDFSEYGAVGRLPRLVLSVGHVILACALVFASDYMHSTVLVYYAAVFTANLVNILLIVVFIPYAMRKYVFVFDPEKNK